MSDIAIKVENISKRYKIGENKTYPTLRDKLVELPNRIFKGPKKNKEFWALKDVSFEVKKGEVVGIIGRNGAGKSTMLKILARITEPTSGKITMHGRVASMLEVGTGFNPELTGRENIYLNGAIIGMTKREIKQKFDDIVEFSGVNKFLDTPVKHYSSGMYVRLAFAVAAHLDADILLVDEVLAVGDAEFQKKCLGKMSELAESGRTVIFVSHNIPSLQSLCSSGILISHGESIVHGKIDLVVKKYLSQSTFRNKLEVKNNQKIIVKKVKCIKNSNNSITLSISIIVRKKINCYIAIGLDNQRLQRVFTASTKFYKEKKELNVGSRIINCMIQDLTLKNGKYYVTILFGDEHEVYEYFERLVEVEIPQLYSYPSLQNPDDSQGDFTLKHDWLIK